ncbi:hypothetical protein EVAR_39581_1 [Eumeta japonica]|uniref:Uncharacterized protein n=1 Tax=Eumeta variegata TaxID=151549 RepID=A0A4C1Y291_EUMVA|nr:hypothetical protein EVAR_39581_1 [Eumeta japonica]
MEQDKFALVERILKDVDNVMCKNGELYAFDIVPMENNWQNKSPVLHLENCLALESWILASNFPQDITIQASENDLCHYSEDNLIEMLLIPQLAPCPTCVAARTRHLIAEHREYLMYWYIRREEWSIPYLFAAFRSESPALTSSISVFKPRQTRWRLLAGPSLRGPYRTYPQAYD